MTKKKNGFREGFELMLADVIVPGIIHNFANPLNGIVGRAKLLKRKIDERLKASEYLHDRDFCTMTGNDVGLICQEADRLSGLLLVISEKFYALNNTYLQRINLSRLLETEVKFSDFNLEFKHNVRKDIRLAGDISEIKGVTSEISFCLGAIFQNIIERTLAGESRELCLTSGMRGGLIVIEFKWAGPQRDAAFEGFAGYPAIVPIFQKYGICVVEEREGEFQVLRLIAPPAPPARE